jgi:5,10-methylenetetrahydromethanopterin reductase
MSNVEFWHARPTHFWHQESKIDASFSFAKRYEDAGYDGMLFFDTQNLSPEVYVSLAAAAKETTTLGLGTGVTNPMTRHAAVAAAAMSTLQEVSNGRAYLGIGRGDSALAHLGYSPIAVGKFEEYLVNLQSYLRGEDVDFPSDADVDDLHLGDQPDASRLQWLQDAPKVPVGVAATGPRVIAISARHADRIDYMLGASAERIKWGMDIAKEARLSAGMEGDQPVSAYVSMMVHDDGEYAWQLAAPIINSQARFMAMHGKINGPVSDGAREILKNIHSSYNMKKHGAHGNDLITSEFAHEFGIYGPPSYCVDRLNELVELGIDRFIFAGGPDLALPQPEIVEMAKRFVNEVLPKFK